MRFSDRRKAAWAIYVSSFLLGLVVAFGVSLCLKPDAEKLAESESALLELQSLTTEMSRCFPVDTGQRTVLWLQHEDGILKLKCETKTQAGYLDTNPSGISLNVPITVN